MIMMLVCFVVLLSAISQYASGKKREGLFIFFIFLSDGFHLLSEEWMEGAPINKYPDFALLYFLFVCTRNIRNRCFYKHDFSAYKTLYVLLFYLVVEFITTVLLGHEQFMFALKTFRTYILIGSYLLVAELNSKDIKKLIKQISVITIFTTILYLIQPFTGLKLLQHASIGDGVDGVSRYRNIPYLAYFFLIYCTLKLKFTSVNSVIYIGIFIAALLLTQHRGIMIGYAMTIVLYLVVSRNLKKAMQYGVIGLFVLAIAGQYLENRFKQDDTSSDIANVLHMDYGTVADSNYDVESGATFSFRVLLFVERIGYLISNPQYLLTGIGTRHEDSPYTKRDFSFYLGTRKPNPQTGDWEPCQISSADMAWLSPLMRFGVLGLFLFCLFTYQNIIFLYRNRNVSSLAMAAFLFYMLLLFISLKNDHLFGNLQLFFLFLFIELLRRYNNGCINNEDFNFNLFKGV